MIAETGGYRAQVHENRRTWRSPSEFGGNTPPLVSDTRRAAPPPWNWSSKDR
jgi:hypothetical protein